MQHFIRVNTGGKSKTRSSDKEYNIFFKISPDTPKYAQWTIQSLFYQTRRKDPPPRIHLYTYILNNDYIKVIKCLFKLIICVELQMFIVIGPVKQKFLSLKFVINFLSISLNMLWVLKRTLSLRRFLLSTNNICLI